MVERPMTRAEAMALTEERRLVEQGYEFLDEKRVILAGEIMSRLSDWQALEARRDAALREARDALAGAVRRYGLETIQFWPVATRVPAPRRTTDAFLGVALVGDSTESVSFDPRPGDPLPIAALTRAFAELHSVLGEMARASANLLRLATEYHRTEQKAKALENILIPEIDSDLKRIEEQLEAFDQEDAIRVRIAAR